MEQTVTQAPSVLNMNTLYYLLSEYGATVTQASLILNIEIFGKHLNSYFVNEWNFKWITNLNFLSPLQKFCYKYYTIISLSIIKLVKRIAFSWHFPQKLGENFYKLLGIKV